MYSEVFNLKPRPVVYTLAHEHSSECARTCLRAISLWNWNDRLYLNGYVPQLQHGPGLVGFLCQHRGQPIASPALLGQITGKFVAEVKSFAAQQAIPLFHFGRKESKDLACHQMRRERPVHDAVVFIGIAQEHADNI